MDDNHSGEWKIDKEVALGEIPDISALLEFTIKQKVLYHSNMIPSLIQKKTEKFLGIFENWGDALAFQVFMQDFQSFPGMSIVQTVLRRTPTSMLWNIIKQYSRGST